MAERSQAEVVGYVLVFSAVVLTVGLVTMSGQAGLVELRDSQRTAGVESGFSALATNTDDVVRGGVPSRGTELGLASGTISFGEPVTVTVEATNSDTMVSESLRPVVYEAPSGARLVYANGAVIARGEGGGTAMLRQPRLLLSSSRTIVPIVTTTQSGDGPGSISGESRIIVRTQRTDISEVTQIDGEIRITVESPRASVWKQYLEAESDVDGDCGPVNDGSVSCTYDTAQASVVVAPVGVSFE